MTITKQITIFKTWILFGILGYWLLVITPPSVNAQSTLGLSAIPPQLELTAEPGQVVTKEIKLRNESNVVKVITSSVKDFIVTNDSGTPITVDEANPAPDASRWASSAWMQLSETKFKLNPGETRSILVTVITPEDALPGGHYAMIVHSPDNEATLSETGSSVVTNVGSLVYITVPGAINQDAQITQFSGPKFQEYGPVNFDTTIKNLSDIHITPVGQITVKNLFNRVIAELPVSGTNIFPYTSRQYQSLLDKKWLFGRYQAELATTYGSAGGVLATSLSFWIIPWRLMILATIALIIIATLLFVILKQPKPPKSSDSEVESLELELETLKKKYKDRS